MAAKQKILIVDDDNNIAELISLYLTKECFDTCIVNDGRTGTARIREFPPGSDLTGSHVTGNGRIPGVPGNPPHLRCPDHHALRQRRDL